MAPPTASKLSVRNVRSLREINENDFARGWLGSRRSVDGRLSVPEASLFRLLQDFRPLQSEHDVHRQGDKPVLLLPAAALEVEGYTYNWALLDDVEDKPVVLVVDAQRPVSGDCRDGVVELITETEANIPVDVGAATAHQSPSR